MDKKNIGLIGLGPMGENLALNIEDKGYSVAVFNRTSSKTEDFINNLAKDKKIFPTYTLKELVDYLELPRKILLMVKQGAPVDDFINDLLPLLNKGDLIIDGGNSYFKDTIRRNSQLSNDGILYVGVGISGGEEGALKGPSLMPGGSLEAYRLIEGLFSDIAAKTSDGIPCTAYIGPYGAGHYVKMVHNGIEYADMQLIGECVWILKSVFDMNPDEISKILIKWNGEDDLLRSYLIEITGFIEKEIDKSTGGYLIDRIADVTRTKGTGTWTIQNSLELGVSIPTIAAAVFSRGLSQEKDLRLKMSNILAIKKEKYEKKSINFLNMVHDSLYIAKISSYAQGFALLQSASNEYKFDLNLAEIAQVWRSGCIIRADFLTEISQAYKYNPNITNLLAHPKFAQFINSNIKKLANLISIAHKAGVPTLALDSAYDYILQLMCPLMISAQVAALQRDYFGAHGYFKIESPDNPKILTDANGKNREFHTNWSEPEHSEVEITN